MKRIATMLLIFLALSTALNFTSYLNIPNANGEPGENWPGTDVNSDGTIDVYDAVEYMKTHYVGYDPITDTFAWSFADSYDITMANNVIENSLEIEQIRNEYKDATVESIIGKSIGLKDLHGVEHPINSANDAAAWVIEMIMKDKSYIMQVLHPPLEWIVNNAPDVLSPDEASQFSSDLADYMIETAEDWLQKLSIQEWKIAQKLKFDTSLSDKLGKYAGKLKIVFTLKTIVDASIKHVLILWETMQSTVMTMIKSHEYAVEIYKWVVDVLGDLVTDALSNVAASKGAAALMVGAGLATANPAIAVGVGIIGYFTIKLTVSDMLSAAWDWAVDEATTRIELLKRLNPLYKFINLKFTGDAKTPIKPMKVKILSIVDEDQDYIIPWGDGKPGEDIEISVVNTGVQDINLRITSSEVPENWQVNKEKVQYSLRVGESKSAIFHVTSYTKEYNWWDPLKLDGYIIHQGDNPGVFKFKFEHDEHLGWWDIGDWFPGGLVPLFDTDVSQTFFNYVDFEVMATADKARYVRGETATVTVTVKNNRGMKTHFFIGVVIRDPHGEYEKYSSQITVIPNEGTLDPSQSGDFTASWAVPSDALIGDYQIGVALWEELPYVCKLYIDNLEFQQIFSIYQMYIVFPTTLNPAEAGDNLSPQRINAFVGGLPSMLWIKAFLGIGDAPVFTATVGDKMAPEVSITWNFAGWGLNIIPPAQDYGGLYDLTITVTFDDVSTSASQANAVKYTGALPTEPIQKGLAWLRTRQYGDGSWQGIVGVTALSVLGFLNAGYDESDPTVQKAIAYLLSRSHGGPIYTDAWGLTRATYETSLAILALVATHNDAHRPIIDNARIWLVNSQWDESCQWDSVSKDHWYYGGFGYGTNVRPDLSNTQFALLALDAAGLPKDDPTWIKAQVFLHRCQKVNFPITLNIEGTPYTVQPWNYAGTTGGYDGGFLYLPGSNPYVGGAPSMGSMTGAGIWGLLLSGVPKTDQRVKEAINWVVNHYTWDTNPNCAGYRRYYYYLSMAKALTMYGEKIIGGHDWYQELYDKITSEMIASGADKAYWSPSQEDYVPDLSTAYAILSMQTRAAAPPVQRLSYLTFILRSNCLMRILDPDGNLVGYNTTSGLGENSLPTAIYSGPFSEPQYVVIINPKFGTYKLELMGTSEGPYGLIIQGNYGETTIDPFEHKGEIKPGEFQGADVTVTSIVGPLNIYVSPINILDKTPPTTKLTIGEPKCISDKIYVTPDTPFTLEATDTESGVQTISYRISNATYDSGWQTYIAPFKLASLADGTCTIEHYSIDNAQNTETTKAITVTLFSWNYIFEDTFGRGTTLKINTAHKFFQFIIPEKDYSVKNATHMQLQGKTIMITHQDSELKLICIAVGGQTDFCVVMAWDKKTAKIYLLLDKPGTEQKGGAASAHPL